MSSPKLLPHCWIPRRATILTSPRQQIGSGIQSASKSVTDERIGGLAAAAPGKSKGMFVQCRHRQDPGLLLEVEQKQDR